MSAKTPTEVPPFWPELKVFWLVWCPDGKLSPRTQYLDEGRAREEAIRRARQNPGRRFYVARAQEFVQLAADPPVETRQLEEV